MMEAVTQTAAVPCSKCGKTYNIELATDLLEQVEKFPFTIILMHTTPGKNQEVHTLLAYIDKDLKCRHVEYLSGKRVFVTPFILYNPRLLQVYCNRKLR